MQFRCSRNNENKVSQRHSVCCTFLAGVILSDTNRLLIILAEMLEINISRSIDLNDIATEVTLRVICVTFQDVQCGNVTHIYVLTDQ